MKKVLAHLRTITVIILSFIVVLEIGFITLRNPLRVDLSKRKFYNLSPRTLSVLDKVGRNVKIIVLFSKEDPENNNPQKEKEMEELSLDMRNLLEEYQSRSRYVSVEWVNPYDDTSYTRDLAIKYNLVNPDGTVNLPVVVFDLDDGEKTTTVRLGDIVEKERSEDGTQTVIASFKGEQAFTSAIHELLFDGDSKVYFLTGHGERSISDTDPLWGLSALRSVAPRENMELAELVLASENAIPEDADVLVIAGPTENVELHDLNLIEGYLNQGGRLLVLLNDGAETGLEPLLERWQIRAVNVVVSDPSASQDRSDVVVGHARFNMQHPITKALVAEELDIVFYKPQIVIPVEGNPPETQTSELFNPWERSYVEVEGQRIAPCLGATAEREVRRELGGQAALSRVVVIGDSDFISNAGFPVGGNSELFMASLNWLLDRDIVISPKPVEEVRPNLTRKQIVNLFWINVAGIPAIAIVLTLAAWYRRRK